MKRAPRTTITWRFENPMAPHDKNYMPCMRNGSSLVSVIVTLFRGKAQFRAWFVDHFGPTGAELAASYREYFFGHEVCRRWTESMGLMPDGSSHDCVGANGDAMHVDFVFEAKNGESLTHTACRTFIAFCDQFGIPEYRHRFYLPTPQIVQETMVEEAADYWIPYGEYEWNRHFAGIADAAADASIARDYDVNQGHHNYRLNTEGLSPADMLDGISLGMIDPKQAK